jgi:hypothetical protein
VDEHGERTGAGWIVLREVKEERDALRQRIPVRRFARYAPEGESVFEGVGLGLELEVQGEAGTEYRTAKRTLAGPTKPGQTVEVELRFTERNPAVRGRLIDVASTPLADRRMLDPRKGQIVELRFFGGLSIEETAEVLTVSPGTVMRDWTLAKAWLRREMGSS